MSCGNTGPFDGGTYNDPVVVNPEVTGGSFASPAVTGTVTLDAAAAASLLAALQELTPEAVTDQPTSSEGEELPTGIIGEDRSVLLGKPMQFIKIGSLMIPAYRAQ